MYQQLENYFSDIELTTLIALVVCHSEISLPLPHHVQGSRELIPDVQDTSGLMITEAWAGQFRRRYWKFLQEFLISQTQTGQCALDSKKYARVALYLLRRMRDPATTRPYLLYDGLYFLGGILDRAGRLEELINYIVLYQTSLSCMARDFQERSTTIGYYSMNPTSRAMEDYKRIILVEVVEDDDIKRNLLAWFEKKKRQVGMNLY